jgi:hypothetical protein
LAGDLALGFGATQDFLLRRNKNGGESRDIAVQLRNFIAPGRVDDPPRPYPKAPKAFILIGC